MKKIIIATMLLVTSLSLCSCGTTEQKTSINATTSDKTSEQSATEVSEVKEISEMTTENNTSESSEAFESSTSTEVDSDEITINYPSGYFEDEVDIMLEMDAEKTQANLKNNDDIYELFGSSLRMGTFLGIEDNGYFLMAIGAGVYYEGTWEYNGDSEMIATCKNLNSDEEETFEIKMDDESEEYIVTIYDEEVYWTIK